MSQIDLTYGFSMLKKLLKYQKRGSEVADLKIKDKKRKKIPVKKTQQIVTIIEISAKMWVRFLTISKQLYVHLFWPQGEVFLKTFNGNGPTVFILNDN